MYSQQIYSLSYEAIILVLILSGPPVLISMIVGLIVAVFQAATQIQEQTLSFTVKLLAVVLVLMLMGGWLGQEVTHFAHNIFSNFYKWR
ncbi:Flagellar biosynthetic protein FliQ [Chlamydiales bacterium SCGC AB-751-O23]|jgi:type III secretion protein S|nr:Flagellar biosynthetic protein FliQ [Chlamydiales bacterium SCGC AB-751-O23]